MMRDCSYVKLIWSFALGPGSGAFGGFPPSFLPASFSLAAQRANLSSYFALPDALKLDVRLIHTHDEWSTDTPRSTISCSRCR